MKALAFAGALAFLIFAFYVAFSEAARQFGFWGFVLAFVCATVYIRAPSDLWGRVSFFGAMIGIAAFAGYVSNVVS